MLRALGGEDCYRLWGQDPTGGPRPSVGCAETVDPKDEVLGW